MQFLMTAINSSGNISIWANAKRPRFLKDDLWSERLQSRGVETEAWDMYPPPPHYRARRCPHNKNIMLNVNQMDKGKCMPPRKCKAPGASPPPPSTKS